MTTWRYSISWSKFKAALECPRQLQYVIDKAPYGTPSPSYYRDAGNLVQKAFELFFNQKINLKPGADRPEVIDRIVDKILKSKFRQDLQTTFPFGKGEEDLEKLVREQIHKGMETFKKLKVLDKEIQSEVKWNATFRGFRIFALIDFIRRGKSGIWILDGKGHEKENADPDQVKYYGLAVASTTGKPLAGGGLLYWSHGYRPVDLSPAAIREFVDTKLELVRPTFEALAKGVQTLPTKPSEETCKKCTWKHHCEDSPYRRDDPTPGAEETTFTAV